MSKEFKEGEYYVFSDTKKKVGKATIYGFVQVEKKPYAIMVISGEASTPVARPIEHDNGRAYIKVFEGYLNPDAPVLPKLVKFRVGEIYTNNDDDKFQITDKYSNCLNGSMHLVLNDEIVADVKPDADGAEHAEFYDGDDFKEIVAGKFTEDEEE